MNEIEMNTSALAGDIESLQNTVGQLEGQMKNMFQAISELDQMWDGPASDAFNQQFKMDYRSCETMCSTLRELIECLRHAGEEYDKCEQNVDAAVRAINI